MLARLFSHSGKSTCAIALLFGTALGSATPVLAAAPANSAVKIVNGKFTVDVDNGWVVYQDDSGTPQLSNPTLRRFVQDLAGSFTATTTVKLKPAGAGPSPGNGAVINVGGITYAPCPAAAAPNRCAATDFGTTGVGLAFGQTTFGAGAAAAGWVNDNTVTANFTAADISTPGTVVAVAVDSVNGAYAVGYSNGHALVMTLNSAAQTYKVTTRTDLGTLGGPTSQATAISANALHVVGMADDATSKAHAVYAHTGASSWTDITGSFPAVIKSRALAASNTGIVAGSATVKRNVGGFIRSVDIGFVYNVNTTSLTFFEAAGANIVPLKVLDDGRVVGNLLFLKPAAGLPGTLNEVHPFMYDGSVHDFGTMILPTSSHAFSCRVNRPNNLGELVGSCIPNNTTPYGVQGTAFYINAVAATPTFINLNASLHANADSTNPTLAPYNFGTATSNDDEHEIAVIGINKTGAQAAFIASKPAYNP
jgi:hypothetical protein